MSVKGTLPSLDFIGWKFYLQLYVDAPKVEESDLIT